MGCVKSVWKLVDCIEITWIFQIGRQEGTRSLKIKISDDEKAKGEEDPDQKYSKMT